MMDACNVCIDYKADKNMQCYSETKEDDRILLSKLAPDGFIRRYGKKNKVALERLNKELKIINELGFNAYFLINDDIGFCRICNYKR
jgi:DNA polymerase III alpha subunit